MLARNFAPNSGTKVCPKFEEESLSEIKRQFLSENSGIKICSKTQGLNFVRNYLIKVCPKTFRSCNISAPGGDEGSGAEGCQALPVFDEGDLGPIL
jgi:hypothetical protein